MNLETIDTKEQKDFIASFWTMLRECESHADNTGDSVLKHMVAGWCKQWNRVTDDDKVPVWVPREAKAAQERPAGN